MQTQVSNQTDLLLALFDNSHEATIASDAKGELIYSNNKARELFDLIGTEMYSPLKRVLGGQATLATEMSFILNDKSTLHLVANARSIYNASKNVLGAIATFQDVTEAKQDRSWIYTRFQAIFEQSPFSISIMSKEGRVLKVNSAYKKLWSLSNEFVEDYIYKVYNIFEDKLLETSGQLTLIKRAFAGESVEVPPFYYDPISLGFEGRARWAGGLVFPLTDEKNEVQEVVVIHLDKTEQFESYAEKENLLNQLTGEKNRLATIIERLPAGVMVVEAASGQISLRNQRMHEMDKKAIRSNSLEEYMDYKMYTSSDKPYTFNELPAIRSLNFGEIVTDEEIKVVYEDGTYCIFCVNTSPVYDPDGKISACVVVNTEITEKKKEASTQSFLDRLKSTLLTTLDVGITIDLLTKSCVPFLADCCYIDLMEGNDLKRTIIAHRDPEIQKKIEAISQLYPPRVTSLDNGRPHLIKHITEDFIRLSTQSEDHFERVLSLGFSSLITIPLQSRGSFFGTIGLVMNKSSNRIFDEIDLATAVNVGKHVSLVLDNSMLYSKAQSTVKLQDEFISIASHELKTPITSMALQLEVLTSIIKNITGSESDHAMKVMEAANRQIDRISRLIDDMLDTSSIASGKFLLNRQNFDLSNLTTEVLERFSSQLDGLGISYQLSAPVPVMTFADPFRLEQVLTNFITNAIRYGNGKPIEISISNEAGKVLLKIKDHGPGISKMDQERIFNRFERSAESHKTPGLGLGLFINRQIIRDHGGSIRLESELGKGSTFIVELPPHGFETSTTF